MSRVLVLGLLTEAGYLVLGQPATPPGTRVAIQAALFLVYLAAAREFCRRPLGLPLSTALWGLAILFRITLVIQAPFYSDDLYRYLWDGHVQVAGHINPYRFAPADPALAPFRNEVLSHVNHPEIPTLYPPAAQMFFAAVSALGGSVLLLKSGLVLFDLALLQVLRLMLRRAGAGEGRVAIYAWSPLVIAEVAGNGHLDALAIFLLLLGIHLIIVGRWGLSTILLGLSAGAKLLPCLTFPVLARRVPPTGWAIPIAVLLGVYAPYWGAGSSLGSGLRQYAERWQHNESLFGVLLGILSALDPTPILKAWIFWLQGVFGDSAWIQLLYRTVYPVYLSRLAVVAALGILALFLARRGTPPIRGSFILLAAFLLLSPTLHPWYVLWVVPFLALRPNRAWMLFTGLVPLSYLGATPEGGWSWLRWAEYLPFFALLILDAARARRGRLTGLFGLQPVSELVAGGGKKKGGDAPALAKLVPDRD